MSVMERLEAAGEVLSPVVRRALVALEDENRCLRARIDPLEGLVATLRVRVRDLEARLGMNSTNSSKPPSSDPPQAKAQAKAQAKLRRKKQRSGRKRGGQQGHAGAQRALVPTERVDSVIEHHPHTCRHCGTSLARAPVVGAAARHQVIELPEVRAHITEHQSFTHACSECGRRTRAELPAALSGKHFGPRLVAFSALLLSRFRMSRRQLTDFYSDLLDVPAPALGTTQAFCREVGAALLSPYRAIRRAVRSSRIAGADETGWWLRALRRWLWVAASKRGVLYRLARRRNAADFEALMGRDYGGVLVTDRCGAYNGHPAERRQLCWAHLMRNFEGLAARGGEAERIGELALAECHRLFHAWHRYGRGEFTHAGLRRELAPLRARLAGLLRRGTQAGAQAGDRKLRAFCRNLLGSWVSLWTFLRVEGVPVTNNESEQALRGAVIHRKLTFGSNSGDGMRFLERILSVSETCRLHQISLLDYLTRAIIAHRENRPAPRLLPAH